MLNLLDSVTITGQSVASIDPDTGIPTYTDSAVMVAQPCAFAVLSAAQHEQAWGAGDDTTTQAVTASLILPNWAPALSAALSTYSVSVAGYTGTWRVLSARPGASWTTYLLALN